MANTITNWEDMSKITNGNCGVVGCWGKDAQGRTTLNGKAFEIGNTYNPTPSSTCLDKNGNKTSCQELQNENLQKAKEDAQKQLQQTNNTKEPIYYIAVTTGALVVGYLLWKKFKK